MPKPPSPLRQQAEKVSLLTNQLQVQLQALERSRVPVSVTFRYPAAGTASDEDIMSVVTTVMMEAARSARDDLRAIMEQVKAATAAKKELCRLFETKTEKTHDVQDGALDFDSMFCLIATLYAKHLDEEADELLASLDSLSEMGTMLSVRLQMKMDSQCKTMSTLSNLLKKISDTSSQIVQNMK